jgi:outer membrane autotransporter protein
VRHQPATPGRDLVEETRWNSWADARFTQSKDQRHLLSETSHGGTLSLGADRLLDDGLVAGGMISLSSNEAKRFSGDVKTEDSGFMFGPYFSYPISAEWSIFASASIGQLETHHRVLSLQGKSEAAQLALALNAQGQYPLSETSYVRPKFGVSYLHQQSDRYQLRGPIQGQQIQVELKNSRLDTLTAQSSVEFNWVLSTSAGSVFMPFLEAGLLYTQQNRQQYAFSNSEDGWQGSARLGLRALSGPSTQVEMSSSYQSIGINDLDSWELQLFISHAFK